MTECATQPEELAAESKHSANASPPNAIRSWAAGGTRKPGYSSTKSTTSPTPYSYSTKPTQTTAHGHARRSAPPSWALVHQSPNASSPRTPNRNRGTTRSLARRGPWRLGVTLRTRCWSRSEEHTSELQSRGHLVCRLLL